MASQSGTFNVQEFSDAGVPLVGGRLYTYAYGTTTQKIAYIDAAGAVPHTYTSDGAGGQFIALNARGELPAALYLATDPYDLALKRADGSTVWTRRADGQSSQTDLTAAGGSALVGFLPTGTGAVARTVQDKLREQISVKDFGAVGDGVTDDAARIQNAINAVINAGGGILYFPPTVGGYFIGSTLNIDYSANAARFANKLHLRGASSSASFIVSSGGFPTFTVKGNPAMVETYFDASSLRLSGTSKTVGSRGIKAYNGIAYLTLHDVMVEGFEIGLHFADVEQIAIYDSNIRWNTCGILGESGAATTAPNSWSFYNTGVGNTDVYGIDITNANAFNFNGGSIQYNGQIGAGGSTYGVKITEAGNGYGSIGFTNMCFEGNAGAADVYSVQNTYGCQMNFNNVSFMRTAWPSVTVTGAANNGAGKVRLAVTSTAPLVGKPAVSVTGVVGTTGANSADPWAFTVIDGTHIDLTGSTFNAPYVSGGAVAITGFANNAILAAGTNASSSYTITGCSFRSNGYLPSASRPVVNMANASAKIADDGTNYYQNAIEKPTYIQAQQIGDDGSAWFPVASTVAASGGTFTATAALRIKKINKTLFFDILITGTSYAAPVAPLTFTLPFAAQAASVLASMNLTNLGGCSALIVAAASTVQVWGAGSTFPMTANGQQLVISGSFETTT